MFPAGTSSISTRPGSATLLPVTTASTGLLHLLVGARVHRVRSDTEKYCMWPLPHTHHFQCVTHIWSPTLFPRDIIIFQGVLTKFHFLTKFPHLEKIVDLMKDLKYEHQSTFPLWGWVKLNFRDRYRKLIFFLRTQVTIKFSTKFSKIVTLA